MSLAFQQTFMNGLCQVPASIPGCVVRGREGCLGCLWVWTCVGVVDMYGMWAWAWVQACGGHDWERDSVL